LVLAIIVALCERNTSREGGEHKKEKEKE